MFKLLNRLLSIFITDKHFPFFIFLFFVFINTYLSSLQLQTNLYTIPWVLFNFLPTLFSPIYIPFLLKPPDTTQYLYHTFSYDYFLFTPSPPPFIYIYIAITVSFCIINPTVKTTLPTFHPYCTFNYLYRFLFLHFFLCLQLFSYIPKDTYFPIILYTLIFLFSVRTLLLITSLVNSPIVSFYILIFLFLP